MNDTNINHSNNPSAQSLVIAYHLIWTGYGWWLPNDPRGSHSTSIHADVIAQLGEIHFGRKSVQPAGTEIRKFYAEATKVLQHRPISFNTTQRRQIGIAFANTIEARRYTCYACAIMPDHVHILIRKHRDQAEEMIEQFKRQVELC